MAGKTESAIGIRRKRRLVSQQMDMFASRVVPGAPDWPDLAEGRTGGAARADDTPDPRACAGDSSANNGGGRP